MTNSREKAEQAFALLRTALEESESQRQELETRLQTPGADASSEDQDGELLQLQLEELRAERDLWKKTSGQLQDVVSNERAKARRLTKKLGTAQSGSDRVNRREVNFWREKANSFDQAREQFQQRIYELKEELAERNREVAELSDNRATSDELHRANDLLAERNNQVAELNASLETHRLRAEELERQVGELNANYQLRIGDIETQHEREILALRDTHANELDKARTAQTDVERELADRQSTSSEEIERLRNEATSLQGTLESERREHAEQLEQMRERVSSLEGTLDAGRKEQDEQLEQLRGQISSLEATLEEERREHAEQLEHRDAEKHAREAMYESALTKERADTADAIRAEFEPRVAALTAQLDEQTNAFAGLEANLAEERTRADNINEIANDRRETLRKTTEKLEEMEERYEDAKWHLGKARHFEKLARRRKKLIANLIGTIRAKQKATNTLKAGLDSLRRYKATADERQQELLRRVEILENTLHESREQLAQANEARRVSDAEIAEKKSSDVAEIAKLTSQVDAQAEVIASLEADLKNSRKAETESRGKLKDFEKLHEDIETKNTFIGTLQKDIEEQQKVRSQLRKRDIELQELRNRLEEQDRQIQVLQSENAQLRNAKNGEIDEIDRKKLAEQDQIIAKLTVKLKEYESTINSLSEAADSWKRKYDFLAAETPYGFESASTSE